MGVIAVLACAAAPSVAVAETCLPYEGQWFPTINGLEDPEDYCFEVQLNEGQTLEEVDDQLAVVNSKTGGVAWEIHATPARDATGAAVPTTLTVTGENLVTLTVHHLAGNPEAGGAPFQYPITPGPSYEAGFVTVTVLMPPATEQGPQPGSQEGYQCEVPSLRGRSLHSARRALRLAHCRLGPVHGERRRGAKVARQYRPAGKALPAGTEVGVRLA